MQARVRIESENMMAEHYHPGDNSSIKLGDTVKWHITIYNHMGTVQYMAIRAKLLNQTTPPPDDMNNTPSSIPTFREIRRVLVDNETWIFPFYWSVESISTSNDSQMITMLKLNNMTITQDLNTTARHGYNFRIVFELWVYGNQSKGFQYGWRSGGEMRSAWVQIWFNLTASTVAQNQTEKAVISGLGSTSLPRLHDEFQKPPIDPIGVDLEYHASGSFSSTEDSFHEIFFNFKSSSSCV